MSFWIPGIAVIVVFWLSFGLFYLLLKSQLSPILRSLRRIEKSVGSGGRTTEEFVTQQQPRPRPSAPSKYVTVERSPKPEYYR